MMRKLSQNMGMHLMNPVRPARSALRGVHVRDDTTVYELHGDLVFVSVESLLAVLQDEPPTTPNVVFDFTRVDEITEVARAMAVEGAQRLRADGLHVTVRGAMLSR
jgi:glutaminase